MDKYYVMSPSKEGIMMDEFEDKKDAEAKATEISRNLFIDYILVIKGQRLEISNTKDGICNIREE